MESFLGIRGVGHIRDEEVAELEGLFRHIYRRDGQANRLNIAGDLRPCESCATTRFCLGSVL